MFARLQGRRFFASQLVVTLHCEYSQAQHRLTIEPNTPSRDLGLFLTLLEERLSKLDLENPVRELELKIATCPEKSRQMDFFEPRITDNDKVLTLLSLLSQSSLQAGLYRIEPSILPEQGWQLARSPEEREVPPAVPLAPKHFAIGERHLEFANARSAAGLAKTHNECSQDGDDGQAISPQPYYSEAVMRAPRPTRILQEPLPLTLGDLEHMKVLSSQPIERIESGWWHGQSSRRDYYFAVSDEGECLWIFKDTSSEDYFLHGFFD